MRCSERGVKCTVHNCYLVMVQWWAKPRENTDFFFVGGVLKSESRYCICIRTEFMGRELREYRLLTRPAVGARLTQFLTYKYTLPSTK